MKRLQEEIDVCLRACIPLILLTTSEDARVTDELKELCKETGRSLVLWDSADFFCPLTGEVKDLKECRDPLSALEAIEKAPGDTIFLLRDFHQCWHNQPRVVRKLRNVAQVLKYSRKSIIITAPTANLPIELRDDVVSLEVSPPDADELNEILDHLARTPGIKINLDESDRKRLINLCLGLSASQAQRVFAKAFVTDGVLDKRDLINVASEKQAIIRESGALRYFHADESADDVGGLEKLKTWLNQRELALTDEAKEYGLPAPKGIMLIGIPGTGKSLSAKMVSNLWGLPLIRLDVGALYGGLVGESEANTRKALEIAEVVAPCVLWIDEMEKSMSVGDGDGGTGQRVLGSLLSWMQDKKKPVFIVATANDVDRLPPELMRRGRFDEVFFLDLPHEVEREAIFKVHLRKRGRDFEKFDIAALAKASEGYVGSEIEQSIIDAMFRAYSDEADFGREMKDADILDALAHMIPMSRAHRERIDYLRSWVVEGRAQSASLAPSENPQEQNSGNTLPLQV